MGCKNEEERIACLLHAATGDLCCRCIIRLFHCSRAEALFRLRRDAHKTGIEITDRGICVAYSEIQISELFMYRRFHNNYA
jgi:hypothetical protein